MISENDVTVVSLSVSAFFQNVISVNVRFQLVYQLILFFLLSYFFYHFYAFYKGIDDNHDQQ